MECLCKKRILTFLLAASMILLTGCHSSNNSTPTGGNPDSSKEELTKLTLNEVAHSIFYAPMYVAIEKDYFRQEGIELELVTGFGADKTMTAVLLVKQISDLWGRKLPFTRITKALLTLL